MVATVELRPGQRLVSLSSGGGGYGDPRARDPGLVRHDVAERWITLDAARAVYGVVLLTEGTELVVDEAATAALRASS
jgi:N-methylhydantoinase B